MTFSADLRKFAVKVERTTRLTFANTATKIHESITEGSPITGAPGQPVDTGFLRNSWQLDIKPTHATVSTNVAYAPVIEHNLRTAYDPKGAINRYGVTGGRIGPALPYGSGRRGVKSAVGGNHSVKMTVAAADRLQAAALREIGDAG